MSRASAWLSACWLLLLVLPAVTVYSAWHEWDVDAVPLLLVSCWLLFGLRLALPGGWFFVVTWPLLMLGIACVVADLARHVDLLALALQWRTFSAAEVATALRPWAGPALGAGVVSAALAAWGWRRAPPARWRRGPVGVFVAGSVLMAALWPAVLWVRAWPANAVLVGVSAVAGADPRLSAMLFPASSLTSPRDAARSWQARRDAPASVPLPTLVLVIGESVRGDHLRECGGPARIRPLGDDALVACDVTAGADATHTAVPLLVSREMPGHGVRVPSDASFLRALAEVGYETHWYGVQDRSIAWPDAAIQAYEPATRPDTDLLLPRLRAALGRPAPAKAIVLHAYNAHEPYCSRYDPRHAPYAVDCSDPAGMAWRPQRSPEDLRRAYANAVDASMGFLQAVISELSALPGPVFLAYTSDHGENLFDDARQLYGHALRRPTRWDITVPAVFWANAAWRSTHAAAWAQLSRNAAQPLMHADIVPTLLGAADVTADDRRSGVVNLLLQPVPPRRRPVQVALGEATDWTNLLEQAADASARR